MQSLRGRVRNGRIRVDEPTDLPDESSTEERAELDAVLLRAAENVRAGRTVDADTVLAELGVAR